MSPDNTYTAPKTGVRCCKSCKYLKTKTKHSACTNGHEFTPDNTYFNPKIPGTRLCVVCCKAKRVKRREVLLNRIGWTSKKLVDTIAEQEGKCSVCKVLLNTENSACADHEHSDPPRPRGVLCASCNLGIGNLKENIETMLAAIAYVKKWKEG
jgi:hypothetical protein